MVIQVLPSQIRDQIAAGEVVERPASVVKELVENSLDAGATKITVTLEQGGKKLIEVRDNGDGMSESDTEKAVLRHATSKITSIDDLFAIQSFGFRGEALAAMASVSHFSITSRRQGDDEATEVSVRAGGQKTVQRVAAGKGTTVRVENLFYPTPARLQYLKTDATEYRAILKEINGFALTNPEVDFTVIKDEKTTIDLPRTDHKSRVEKILRIKGALIELNRQSTVNRGVNVTGYVCAPGECARSKNQQWIFVNNRRIEDHKLAYAVREAYVQSCGIEKHLQPVFCLFLELDPLLVDVNVHPRKLEVKFAEPGDVFSAVKSTVMESLRSFSMGQNEMAGVVRSFAQFKASGSPARLKVPAVPTAPSFGFGQRYQAEKRDITSWAPGTSPGQAPNSPALQPSNPQTGLKVICQLEKKYILASSDQGIFFFDQHALHERQRFEVFWQEYKEQVESGEQRAVQKLVVPQRVYLSESDVSLLAEQRLELQRLGLLVQFPTDNCVAVLEIPQLLENEDLKSVFERIVAHLQNGKIGENILDQIMRKILEYKACRGAVMFGDRLDMAEMEKLIADFDRTDWKLLCPHGRPNHWFVPYSDLDKQFHR